MATATTVLPPKVARGLSGGVNTRDRFSCFTLHWDPRVTPLRAGFPVIAPKNPLISRDFFCTSIRRRTGLKNEKPILRRSHVAQNIGLRWEQLKSGLVQERRLRKKSICGVALHLSSLRPTSLYASFLKIRAPCIWSFLLCRLSWRLFTKSSRKDYQRTPKTTKLISRY
jgi:hypothetical protein